MNLVLFRLTFREVRRSLFCQMESERTSLTRLKTLTCISVRVIAIRLALTASLHCVTKKQIHILKCNVILNAWFYVQKTFIFKSQKFYLGVISVKLN